MARRPVSCTKRWAATTPRPCWAQRRAACECAKCPRSSPRHGTPRRSCGAPRQPSPRGGPRGAAICPLSARRPRWRSSPSPRARCPRAARRRQPCTPHRGYRTPRSHRRSLDPRGKSMCTPTGGRGGCPRCGAAHAPGPPECPRCACPTACGGGRARRPRPHDAVGAATGRPCPRNPPGGRPRRPSPRRPRPSAPARGGSLPP
mmetsp:Transcript_21573/g.43500  ORF Transcript_21573/g.43500 Transcript_21573/m.43500 type:complete len:203 (+) Transcript_21573:479-1087(+)